MVFEVDFYNIRILNARQYPVRKLTLQVSFLAILRYQICIKNMFIGNEYTVRIIIEIGDQRRLKEYEYTLCKHSAK